MSYETEVEILISCGFDPRYAAWSALIWRNSK